ncbi:undecaprenyldiphospho-muramoylpentapeptide beta-N-acetylglucosaminyltransferase [Powellomyces hirtus]|uniref:UDP-N-acetylglucosamine transferase subunit ALG13 n=1 Tax=Powellomyces hirtus TaxID=109895 RepID=A0A507EAA6_9FUNG|nr:undecaprenyldiphospho-muramoylpentapeptide beta-N-acetylglucosaminyltransferase [Powellomyces hirtus]
MLTENGDPVRRPQRTVFVTVGTTQFNDLVNMACTLEFLLTLQAEGYTELIIQHGAGPLPKTPTHSPIPVKGFAFKGDLSKEIENAALVISHAGAGLILESLSAGKPLLVVVNRGLMDNHQMDLAVALAKMEVLVWADVEDIIDRIAEGGLQKLKAFGEGDPDRVTSVLEEEAGFVGCASK